ncbi:hypothetical protein [Anaerosinus massiliensis]|uniref:hypothetical protein n=1 Tax=Massilibacillus massiliensis TaxID=1806837 RepID=UPI000A541212|nr:hypothetical protein [Massilibacillus massiliensis]
MTDKRKEEDKRAKWEHPEIDDFQDDEGEEFDGYADGRKASSSSASSYSTYSSSKCYPGKSWVGVCHPRKGMCYPYGYGGYGGYGWYIHQPPVFYGCYPRYYYGGHGMYCRPYGFNYGMGYGCYPRR